LLPPQDNYWRGGGPPSKAIELEKAHPESPLCGSWGQPQTPLLAQG